MGGLAGLRMVLPVPRLAITSAAQVQIATYPVAHVGISSMS